MTIDKPAAINLRALELDDYKTTIKWRNDDAIWDGVLGEKYFVSTEYERKWVQDAIFNKNEVRLGVCLRETGELIGLASIVAIDWINRNARTQIMIGEQAHWGQGYGAQAMNELLRFAFLQRGFERMWVRILESNLASITLHEKLGYKREGMLRRAVFKNGKFNNVVVLSILRSEFEDLNKNE